MRILVLTSLMHAKPKEEMEDIVCPPSEFSLHRVLLLLHMNHVPPQKLRELRQPLQQHQWLGMTSMEQMSTKAAMAMRWIKTLRLMATNPWMSRWA